VSFVYLDYYKAVREHKLIDIKSFYSTYNGRSGYKMLTGTPLIVNVDGYYVKADDLTELTINRSLVPIVLKWISAVKYPLVQDPPSIILKWRR